MSQVEPTEVVIHVVSVHMIGRAPFKGNQTHKIDTTIKLPDKPKSVLVNAHYEVLAWDPSKKKKQ